MSICKTLTTGVFGLCVCAVCLVAAGSLAATEHSQNLLRTSATPRLSLTPIDLCVMGGRNICSTQPSDENSPRVSSLESTRPIRIEPKPPARTYPHRSFIVLSGIVYTAAWIDMHRTYPRRHRIAEQDPFVRPLLKLPAPAYYATGFVLATGINYLSWRMSRSKRFHRIWFLPQVLTIAGNTYGRLTSTDPGRSVAP